MFSKVKDAANQRAIWEKQVVSRGSMSHPPRTAFFCVVNYNFPYEEVLRAAAEV